MQTPWPRRGLPPASIHLSLISCWYKFEARPRFWKVALFLIQFLGSSMFGLYSLSSIRSMAAKIKAIDGSFATIEFDTDGNIITANASFLATVGYTLEEVRGKHHSMFCEPNIRETPEYKGLWKALNRGEAQTAEFRRFGKGGREIWLQARYSAILGRGDKPVRIMKVAMDIQKLEYPS